MLRNEWKMRSWTTDMGNTRSLLKDYSEHSEILKSIEESIVSKSINVQNCNVVKNYLEELLLWVNFCGSVLYDIDPEKIKKILNDIVVIKGGK